jgi:hypothetical protein
MLMPTIELLRKMKREGVLGDFVRIRKDGTVLLRARTIREGYDNGLRVHRLMQEYAAKNCVTTVGYSR